MEIAFLLILIMLNGLLAMSEIAIVTARRVKLNRLAEDGHSSALAAMHLHENPTSFLSTVQIGITSIGILNGIVGEAVLAEPLAVWLQTLGMKDHGSHVLATTFIVIIITYISIVIGELVPKRIGQFNPELIACRVARPMMLVSRITHPFVRLLSLSTDVILDLFKRHRSEGSDVIEQEIHALLEEGSEAGLIDQHENLMIRNVFRLDDRPIRSLMIHRADIVYLDVDKTLEENREIMMTTNHALYPVCSGGLSHILGVVHTKQLLLQLLQGKDVDLTAELNAAEFVPESISGMDLLKHFRGSNSFMAFVVDEYGDVEGLATPQDVLKTLVGELTESGQQEGWAVQRSDGSWLLDGLMSLPELKDLLGWKMLPEESKNSYHTLSGLIMCLLGHLPQTGELTSWEGWQLEIVDLDGKRVDKVLAKRLES